MNMIRLRESKQLLKHFFMSSGGFACRYQVARTSLNVQKRSLEKLYGMLDFNEIDYHAIDARALELYNQFREERWRLGLGDFENIKSLYFEKYYSGKSNNLY